MADQIALNGLHINSKVQAEISSAIDNIGSHIPDKAAGRVFINIHPHEKFKHHWSVLIKTTGLSKEQVIRCEGRNLIFVIKKAQKKMIFQISRLKKKLFKKRKRQMAKLNP